MQLGVYGSLMTDTFSHRATPQSPASRRYSHTLELRDSAKKNNL